MVIDMVIEKETQKYNGKLRIEFQAALAVYSFIFLWTSLIGLGNKTSISELIILFNVLISGILLCPYRFSIIKTYKSKSKILILSSLILLLDYIYIFFNGSVNIRIERHLDIIILYFLPVMILFLLGIIGFLRSRKID